ncbi:MAG: GspE/PulE family protein [Candidatus Omnitrophica bacterium]|nr:GspE/PulE family protein [Candidatus Omnitrophota bacterium]
MKREYIIKLLLEKENLREEQIEIVLKEKEKTGSPFGYLLIKFGLISAERWYNFVLKEIKWPSVKLNEINLDKDILKLLPEFTCKKYRTIPIFKGDKKIICAMVDPLDENVIDEIKKIIEMDVETRLAKEYEIKETIDTFLSHSGIDITSPFEKKEVATKIFKPIKIKEISELSAVSVVEELVAKAIDLKATDIHLEIEEEGLRLRYRINGFLYEFPPPPLELYSSIVSHVKVLSNLDISEKRIPQDGYFKMKLQNRDVDLRVSTFPTIFGETLSLRILDKKNILSGLEQLGFLPEVLHRWRILLEEPYGMILVTGPTGSGKTTTLYASLNELDSIHKKIITIEDPVEYHLINIDQTQINPKSGLTFSVALRSMLRQDPDIIMVGEIRDMETAEIAFRAAQTGHLVLSTLHTNTAPGVIIRLLDMGVEPYLISSSLIGVLNQRLVRSICPYCKENYNPYLEEIKLLEPSLLEKKDIKFYRGKGCHLCNGTGYGGRTGIFELMIINEELRRVIMKNSDISELKKVARRSGMETLREDGIKKIISGITTISEVYYNTRKED